MFWGYLTMKPLGQSNHASVVLKRQKVEWGKYKEYTMPRALNVLALSFLTKISPTPKFPTHVTTLPGTLKALSFRLLANHSKF